MLIFLKIPFDFCIWCFQRQLSTTKLSNVCPAFTPKYVIIISLISMVPKSTEWNVSTMWSHHLKLSKSTAFAVFWHFRFSNNFKTLSVSLMFLFLNYILNNTWSSFFSQPNVGQPLQKIWEFCLGIFVLRIFLLCLI